MSDSSSKSRLSLSGSDSATALAGSRTSHAAPAASVVNLPSPDQSPSSHFFRRSVNSTAATLQQQASTNDTYQAQISEASALSGSATVQLQKSPSSSSSDSNPAISRSTVPSQPLLSSNNVIELPDPSNSIHRKRKTSEKRSDSISDSVSIKRERRTTLLADDNLNIDINTNTENHTYQQQQPPYYGSQQHLPETTGAIPDSAIASSSSSSAAASTTPTIQISTPPIISSTSTTSRRHAHILSEQRRRENINGGFQLLKNSVPFCKGSQDSKAMILKKAVDYILLLEHQLHRGNYIPQHQIAGQVPMHPEMYPHQPPPSTSPPPPASSSHTSQQPINQSHSNVQHPQPEYPQQHQPFYPQGPPSRSVTPAVPTRTQTPGYDASPGHQPLQSYPYPAPPNVRTQTPPVPSYPQNQGTPPSHNYQYTPNRPSYSNLPAPLKSSAPRPPSPVKNGSNPQRSAQRYPSALGPRAASFSYSQRRRASTPFGLAAASAAAAAADTPDSTNALGTFASNDPNKQSSYAYNRSSNYPPSGFNNQQQYPPPPPLPTSSSAHQSQQATHSQSTNVTGPGIPPSHGLHEQGQALHSPNQSQHPVYPTHPPSAGSPSGPYHQPYAQSHSYYQNQLPPPYPSYHQPYPGNPYPGHEYNYYNKPGITRPTSTPPLHGSYYSNSNTLPPYPPSQAPPLPKRLDDVEKESSQSQEETTEQQDKQKESYSDSEPKDFGLPMPRPSSRAAYVASSTSTSISSIISCVSSASSVATTNTTNTVDTMGSTSAVDKAVAQAQLPGSENVDPKSDGDNTQLDADKKGSEVSSHDNNKSQLGTVGTLQTIDELKSKPSVYSSSSFTLPSVKTLADVASKCDSIEISRIPIEKTPTETNEL